MFGNNAGTLFIQNVNDRFASAGDDGEAEQQGQGCDQALCCGNQGHGDVSGHDFGVTGTKQGDGLEGTNHTGNGSQQTKQRAMAAKF